MSDKSIFERDMQWWEHLCGVDSVPPEPEKVKEYLMAESGHHTAELIREAVAKRDQEWASQFLHFVENHRLFFPPGDKSWPRMPDQVYQWLGELLAAEREACVKIAEEMSGEAATGFDSLTGRAFAKTVPQMVRGDWMALDIAKAIRDRGQRVIGRNWPDFQVNRGVHLKDSTPEIIPDSPPLDGDEFFEERQSQ